MDNILEMLENTAEKYPSNVIFEDEQTSITYESFVKKAKIAGTVIGLSYPAGNAVPIFMDKSVQTLIYMFGAVYAGCFYTIIDTSHPISRINNILTTLGTTSIVTSKEYMDKLDKLGFEGKTILIENFMENTPADECFLNQIRTLHTCVSPLYCNFTSGSTGIPKGVVVNHSSVIDFIEKFTKLFHITCENIIGNQAPFDFDVSVKDIYSTIYTGAKMVIIPKKKFSFPMELMDYLIERNITTLIWAVSALCIISTLKGFTYKVPDKIKTVIFSGEVMPIKQLKIWQKYLPKATYVNVYGPTEVTCNCTYFIVPKVWENENSLPIGIPFPNEKVILLDEQNKEIKECDTLGEICVCGRCLALGYYNNPEQTNGAFVQNPLNQFYYERMYRTGDLGYYDRQGRLYYGGRIDFQIKHMGHRIELGEIEKAMEGLEHVDRVCCIFNQETNNIEAYYKGSIEKKEIKKALKNLLPAYMIPMKMYQLEEFPLTKNGKIDRNALKLMENCE